MKNLKKVLALVLAFACAFTMFAGAAFTDSADIEQTEAVEMLSALGVINGYTDGSFKPNDTISRAEAAKMIYTIWNGGNDNAAAFEGKSVFTDVYSGHWAEGYINFCYTNGIINGKGNSQFAPDDKVTGTELAKMLLICMGYQADKSGLTGTGYSQRTNALASQNGLYDDVTAAVAQAMPRQYAAQIMYNALKADTVKWSTDANAYEKVTTTAMVGHMNDDGTISFTATTVNETMGNKCMDLVTDEKILLTQVDQEEGRTTYNLNNGAYTRVATDYSNLIGQRVNVMHKENDTSKVYGVYAYEDSKVVATGYVGQLETVAGGEKVKLAGTEYKVEDAAGNLNNAATIVYNLNKDTVATDKLSDLATKVVGSNRNRNDAASEIKLIDNNGNGKVDTAVLTPVKIGQVNSVTATSVTMNNNIGTKKFADDTIYDGIAKYDYVRVIGDDYVSAGGNHVEKLDVINAKVEGTRTDEAKVDGTWYKLVYDGSPAAPISVETNTTYDMVIVGNTILYAEETEGSVTDVAYISAVASTGDLVLGTGDYTQDARMYFADGTDATVTVSKVAGNKLANRTALDGYDNQLYTYTKLSDGTYDIEAVSATNLAGCDSFRASAAVTDAEHGSVYYDSKIGGVSIAEDAVIFVETGKETKVLTGAQVKNWDKTVPAGFTSAYLTETTNGIEYIAAATLVTGTSISVPGAKDTSYAYAVVNQYLTTLNGEKKIAVDAWNGTETVTLYADSVANFNTHILSAGQLFSYKVNGNYIEDVAVANTPAAVFGFDGKAEGELRLKVAGYAAQTYTLAEDCVVLTVDDAANEGVAGASIDSIVEAGYNTSGSARVANIYYMLGAVGSDDAGKIVAIVIDSENNKLDPETTV